LDFLLLGDEETDECDGEHASSMHQAAEPRPRQVVCVIPRIEHVVVDGPWYRRPHGLHMIFPSAQSIAQTGQSQRQSSVPPGDTAVPTLVLAQRLVHSAIAEYCARFSRIINPDDSRVIVAARGWLASTAGARLAELRRAIAARTIQRAWRRCVADPGFAACRRRLAREFEALS
jgi:hypothetical protein